MTNTPFTLYEKLKKTYEDYIKTRDNIRDISVRAERDALISNALFQPPYLEHIAKYESDENWRQGLNRKCDDDFIKFIQFPDSLFPNYPLYTHQRDALNEKYKHVIVTTGTGSGKTETFLLPVIRNLIEESSEWEECPELIYDNWKNSSKSAGFKYQREGERRPAAIRAMILYPLNALVDDQLIRLRRVFNSREAIDFFRNERKNNKIYFGRYTSSTPIPGKITQEGKLEKLKKQLREISKDENSKFIDANGDEAPNGKYFIPTLNSSEMYSRWDMQEYPPDIMITNYSMLNIMLMRDVESSIFEKTRQWLHDPNYPERKFQLIIDELHSYRGTAGTEVAYLIRQFLDRLGISPNSSKLQILASSASLGENDEKSKEFLKEFFGVSNGDDFTILNGKLKKPDLTHKEFKGNIKEYQDILEKPEALDKKLSENNAVNYLKSLFFDGERYIAKSIKQLSQETGKPEEFFEELISAVSKSGEIGKKEFPIRAHYLFRNLRGVWACTNPHCAEVEEKYKRSGRNIGKLYTEPKTICNCGSRILELLICPTCGELFLGGYLNEEEQAKDEKYLFPIAADMEKLPELCSSDKQVKNYILFKPDKKPVFDEDGNKRGQKIKFPSGKENTYKWVDAKYNSTSGLLNTNPRENDTGMEVMCYHSIPSKTNDLNGLALPFKCPYCNDDWSRNEDNFYALVKPMSYGFQKINQILGDTLLKEQNKKNLILFTDSRQDAAKLSAGIEMDHYRDTIRQAAYSAIKSQSGGLKRVIELAQNENPTDDEIEELDVLVSELGEDARNIKDYCIAPRRMPELKRKNTAALIEKINSNEILISFDVICEVVEKTLLSCGINPGGYTQNIFEENKKWDELYLWDNGVFCNANSNIDLREFRRAINNSLKRELLRSLLDNKRGFEALGLAIVTFDKSKYNNLTEKEMEEINAIIRILGERTLYQSSKTDGRQDVPKEVKQYLCNLYGFKYRTEECRNKANSITEIMKDKLGLIDERYRLIPEKLLIQPHKKDFYYVCPSCRKIHLNNARGICTNIYCGKNLERVDGKIAKTNDFYFNLANEEPRKLTCEEMTAQTAIQDQKSRQRRFQDIYINTGNSKSEWAIKDSIEILSVTTTMEAGVDIGALESVMMANMPPQRFNYQQRVGRAGRRNNALAAAVTVCRSRSHDEYYFKNPDKVTNEPTLPPYLDMRSERIIRRFVNKEVLRRAIQEFGVHAEYERSDSVHGEFGSTEEWINSNTKHIVSEWIKQNRHVVEEILDNLLMETQLKNKRDAILEYVSKDFLNDINNAVARNRDDYDVLSELLANAGIIPMFGFPTRTRNLITYMKDGYGIRENAGINRDLDVALSQFAPKAETVQDKKIHISIGVESAKLTQGQSKKFIVCKKCKNLRELDDETVSRCPNCQSADVKILKTIQPENFFTMGVYKYYKDKFFDTRVDFDGNFEFAPFSQRPQINQKGFIPLTEKIDNGNCKYLKNEELVQIVSINDNAGKNYTFTKMYGNMYENFWICNEAVDFYWDKRNDGKPLYALPEVHDAVEEDVALMSAKMTDIFLTEIDKIPAGINLALVENDEPNIYAKSAYYSLAFMLRDAAAKYLDIDEKEIVVGLKPVWNNDKKCTTAQVFLSDALENGAGYSRWLSQDNHLKSIIDTILDKNKNGAFAKVYTKEHEENCDSSCYLCLQDYANLHYHGLLNWRLGLDMVNMMMDKNFVPSLEISYWKSLAEKSVSYLANFLKTLSGEEFAADIERFIVKGSNKIYRLTHPLESFENTSSCCYINILDVIKRPNIVQKIFKETSGIKDSKTPVKKIKSLELVSNGKIQGKNLPGGKPLNVDDSKSRVFNTCSEAFEKLIPEAESSKEKELYKKLAELTSDGNYESPIKGAILIDKKDGSLVFHPRLFWKNSHAALFLESQNNKFKIFNNAGYAYCAFCLDLDDDFDIEDLLKTIKLGE